MSITLAEAKALTVSDVLYSGYYRNADGTPQRWRVNGKVKFWKTRPWDFRIPVKHGLYAYGYVEHTQHGNSNASGFFTTEDRANNKDTHYKIVRHFQNRSNRVVERMKGLENAQRHCESPDTHSQGDTPKTRRITRKYGYWFDGYSEDKD